MEERKALGKSIRNNLVTGIETGNNIIDIKRVFDNPTDYNLGKAVNGVNEILERFDRD